MNILTKTFALILFGTSITLFVAYRGGFFHASNPASTSPNGSNLNGNGIKYDSVAKPAMHSTKSLGRPSNEMLYFYVDTAGAKHYVSKEEVYGPKKPEETASPILDTHPIIVPSSKSAIMFSPEDLKVDSTLFIIPDTNKPVKQNTKGGGK